MTAAIKARNIGPVVGVRTWGGVIGIDVPLHELVDGTQMSVPRYAFWFDGLGWGVENYGVDPDVEVLISPDDWAAGLDPQLQTAVRMALAALEQSPAARAARPVGPASPDQAATAAARRVTALAVRQLVWDMDGTLLDSSSAVPAAFVAAIAQLGGPPVTAGQVVASYARGPAETILAHLAGRELAAAEHDVYYRELAGVAVTAYAGVLDVLGGLRARGHAIAVFTGASKRAAVMLLASAGVSVDVLVGGDEVGRPKPAPDGVLLAADRLGVPAAEIAYIGDSPLDLRAAVAAGSTSAAAAWGHQYDAAEAADYTLANPRQALQLLG